MRILIPLLILGSAQMAVAAAAAQPVIRPNAALERHEDAALTADQQALRQREVALQNQLASEAARARADQAVGGLATANARPAIAQLHYDPKAPPPELDLSQFAQIPDASLAASNARAVAASQNKR